MTDRSGFLLVFVTKFSKMQKKIPYRQKWEYNLSIENVSEISKNEEVPMAAQNTKTTESGLATVFHPNPLVRKISRIEETDANAVSYHGIAAKCIFYLVMVLVGALGAILCNRIYPTVIDFDADIYQISAVNAGLLVLSLLLFIVTPILAFLIVRTIPVTGTLYCVATGFLYSYLPLLAPEYGEWISLAIVLTVAVVAAMAFIYARGIIKVTSKFRSVLATVFFSLFAAAIVMLVCALIPATRGIVTALSENPVLGIIISVVYVVIAALFLLVDFDTIRTSVEQKLPKKYEWIAAFSLVFSIIWLFLKILDLLVQINNSRK